MSEPEKIMEDGPWLDVRLTEEIMNFLWGIIGDADYHDNVPKPKHYPTSITLISCNDPIIEEVFYKNALEKCTVTAMKEWMYFPKDKPPPVFKLKELWVNYQKQHEFIPPHTHKGVFSFVVFMKIPTHWKEQHALPEELSHQFQKFFTSRDNVADFQFLLGQEQGFVKPIHFPLCPEDAGRMLFFPAWLLHQVFPFYGTEEERITLSGNIDFE